MAKMSNPHTVLPGSLSRERVLRAAVRLADEGGIESLSMRKLAQDLGVKAMSLYNHVANKDDLLDGIVDIVVSEIEVPNLGVDWKTAMRRRAMSAHEVLLRHPWSTMPLVSRVNVGPAMLRYVDATLGCLREAGFSLEMADRAWNAIDSHIYGFTLQELNFPFETEEYSEAAKNGLSLIPADKYPYLNRLTHYVMEGRYDGIHDFEFGLELILNGLDRFLHNA
ncbi:TetR/AcrR family transcriptional regulator C-terminal domain-containing protein [Microcoleus sp. herbarium2]|uniref:TetR/AcrR family transcriptional regulator C-terminal domain-containing protein n=1 Tax=Microcoleus sp. herbarium2 TaxID=3055433 RepID=UPI002FD282B2